LRVNPLYLTYTLFPYTTLFRSYRTLQCSDGYSAQLAGANVRKRTRHRVHRCQNLARDEVGNHWSTAAIRHMHHVGLRHHLEELRSEEHTSELQSLTNLVCRLLL